MTRGVTRGEPLGTDRGNSNVVGVAVLLGVTMVALGGLVATIGGVVQQQAGSASATRVGAGFEASLQPVEATGSHRGEVSFTEGELAVERRQVRILRDGHVERTIDVGALVYRTDGRRVAFLNGAVVRGTGTAARFRRPPPLTAGEDVVVFGAAALNAPDAPTVAGRVDVTLRTNVSHERSTLGDGRWAVAVETATPAPWRSHFADEGAEVSTRDFDGDGVPSVVARFSSPRRAYLVVHAMHLEVDAGG